MHHNFRATCRMALLSATATVVMTATLAAPAQAA
jgi:hypothetical protein